MLPVLADGTNRTTTADIRLGQHLIPKGTMVWVPLTGLFNSPHNWADPGQYIPARPHLLLTPSTSLYSTTTRRLYRPAKAFWSPYLSIDLQERWEDANAEYALPLHASKSAAASKSVHVVAVDAKAGAGAAFPLLCAFDFETTLTFLCHQGSCLRYTDCYARKLYPRDSAYLQVLGKSTRVITPMKVA